MGFNKGAGNGAEGLVFGGVLEGVGGGLEHVGGRGKGRGLREIDRWG